MRPTTRMRRRAGNESLWPVSGSLSLVHSLSLAEWSVQAQPRWIENAKRTLPYSVWFQEHPCYACERRSVSQGCLENSSSSSSLSLILHTSLPQLPLLVRSVRLPRLVAAPDLHLVADRAPPVLVVEAVVCVRVLYLPTHPCQSGTWCQSSRWSAPRACRARSCPRRTPRRCSCTRRV